MVGGDRGFKRDRVTQRFRQRCCQLQIQPMLPAVDMQTDLIQPVYRTVDIVPDIKVIQVKIEASWHQGQDLAKALIVISRRAGSHSKLVKPPAPVLIPVDLHGFNMTLYFQQNRGKPAETGPQIKLQFEVADRDSFCAIRQHDGRVIDAQHRIEPAHPAPHLIELDTPGFVTRENIFNFGLKMLDIL